MSTVHIYLNKMILYVSFFLLPLWFIKLPDSLLTIQLTAETLNYILTMSHYISQLN